MAKGIRVEIFIQRRNGADVTPELQEKILRKFLALAERLGCRGSGIWRLGDPPEVEDEIGKGN